MRHATPRVIVALLTVLLLITLVACGGESTPDDDSTTDDTSSSSPATYPPAPGDVSGLSAWFEQAYPDAPWLSRIISIEYVAGEVPGSGGYANAVVITTDLDFQTEVTLGQAIGTALGETHLTWAAQYVIWFADGNNETAGDIVDMTP